MNTFQTNLLEGNISNLVSDFILTPVVSVTPGPTPAPTPIICLTTDPTPILYQTPTSTPVVILTTDPTPILILTPTPTTCLTLDQTQTLFLCLPPTQTQIISLTMVLNPSLTANTVITIDEICLNEFSLPIQLWNVENAKFQYVSFNFAIFRSSLWCLIKVYNISSCFIIFHPVIRVLFLKI